MKYYPAKYCMTARKFGNGNKNSGGGRGGEGKQRECLLENSVIKNLTIMALWNDI